MPRLGLGVYQNYTTHDSVLEAFRAGYKYVTTPAYGARMNIHNEGSWTLRKHIEMRPTSEVRCVRAAWPEKRSSSVRRIFPQEANVTS